MAHFRAGSRLLRRVTSDMLRSQFFGSSADGNANFIDFNNAAQLLGHRTNAEIARSMLVLQLCSVDFLVDRSLQLMTMAERLLPRTLFEYIMKKTFHGQFVAGNNHEEVILLARRLASSGIRFMPAASIEDELEENNSGDCENNRRLEESLDFNTKELMNSIDLAEKLKLGREDYQQTAKVALKLTGLFKPSLLLHEHMQEMANKSGYLEEYNNGMKRFTSLIESLRSGNLSAFIDAEYSYVQPAIRSLVLYMQSLYNKQHPVILSTQQTYLKAAEEDNRVNLTIADKYGFMYGTKVVRGAYMDKERSLAKKHGYQDPIHSTYNETSSCYNRTLDVLLQRAAAGEGVVMAATHNEDSVKFGLRRMSELGIRRQSGQALFAQQYGMCDHVTFALGQNGYLVYKYSPYGDISSTMRYLNRRALENRTALKGLRQEKHLLFEEWKRRLSPTST